MAKAALALRVANLEAEVAQLKVQLTKPSEASGDWLDAIYGVFDNDPIYAEAMRLGREYRESLRPKATRTNESIRKKTSTKNNGKKAGA